MTQISQTGNSLVDINDSLYEQGMTDGLPIIPPTEERVDEMLQGTDRPRDDVIGTLGNRDDPITVELLATNAVMAGCMPTHLPVLIAGIEALADPWSNSIQFSVSTGSWAYLWLINGPVRHDLDIQCDTGAFGPGFRANRAIGRALGLAYKNTTRIYPGVKDMATVGSPFKYSLIAGENEELNPWEPLHVTEGFDEDDSTITLGGPNSFIVWSPYDNDAHHVLEGMVYHTDLEMFGRSYADHQGTIVYALNPYNAEELSEAGLSKQEVKEYICDNSHTSIHKFARGALRDAAFESHADEKVKPLQVPQISDPEYIRVVTIGGGGRFNATIGRSIGGPVTKPIEFPDGWEDLLERYRVEPNWVKDADYYG